MDEPHCPCSLSSLPISSIPIASTNLSVAAGRFQPRLCAPNLTATETESCADASHGQHATHRDSLCPESPQFVPVFVPVTCIT